MFYVYYVFKSLKNKNYYKSMYIMQIKESKYLSFDLLFAVSTVLKMVQPLV